MNKKFNTVKNQLWTIIWGILPKRYGVQWRNFEILAKNYGQYNSVRKNSSIDEAGNPVPWYTYPAIEYIKQFDYSDKTVFEWGSGNSTLFWASRSKEVISVEHNRKWFEKINSTKPGNSRIILAEDNEYTNAISNQGKKFDVIVIDGYMGYGRENCARLAPGLLKENGLLILDNSDWNAESCRMLREAGFNQVDFCGFSPINSYTLCTSLFFKDFKFTRISDAILPIGGIKPDNTMHLADNESV